MVVPEQRHALLQRRGRFDHLAHPPGLDVKALAQLLLAKRLLIVFCLEIAASQRWRSRYKRWSGVYGFSHLRTCDEIGHDLLRALAGNAVHLGLGGREAAANQQVPGLIFSQVGRCRKKCGAGEENGCKQPARLIKFQGGVPVVVPRRCFRNSRRNSANSSGVILLSGAAVPSSLIPEVRWDFSAARKAARRCSPGGSASAFSSSDFSAGPGEEISA